MAAGGLADGWFKITFSVAGELIYRCRWDIDETKTGQRL
jgi:hypothetical protein